MIITARDGKDGFKTVEECMVYEAELDRKEREAKEKRAKLLAEKESRYSELDSLYGEVKRKAQECNRDYGVHIYFPEIIV